MTTREDSDLEQPLLPIDSKWVDVVGKLSSGHICGIQTRNMRELLEIAVRLEDGRIYYIAAKDGSPLDLRLYEPRNNLHYL